MASETSLRKLPAALRRVRDVHGETERIGRVAENGGGEKSERGPRGARARTLKGPTQSSCCWIVAAMKTKPRTGTGRGAKNVSDGEIEAYATR